MEIYRMRKFTDLALICENHLFHTGNQTTDYNTINFLMSVILSYT